MSLFFTSFITLFVEKCTMVFKSKLWNNDTREQYDNNYSSVSEIISKVYTRPLALYKHAARSRFREAYDLIINKEHGTKKQALDLGLELMFNSSLHPAIITACKSLDELDVYLSCLEYNELQDFKFFKVEYDIVVKDYSSGPAGLIGDANIDGEINIKDATAIQKFVAGIETGFAIGEPIA